MTVGNKVTDNTALVECFDRYHPSMQKVNVTYKPVGYYHKKIWSGADNPPEPIQPVFNWYWRKVEREVDSTVGGIPKPKYTYLQRWEQRRMKPRRAYLIEHPYTVTIESYTDCPFTYQWKNSWPPYATNSDAVKTFRQIYGEGYNVDSTSRWSANDTIALQGKLRERIVGSDFDMSVFLGEGRETLHLLFDSATRIRKAYTALRRGDLRSVCTALGVRPPRAGGGKWDNLRNEKDAAKHYAQRWLEVQYGWAPLVQDAYGAAHALAQQLNYPAVQTYRVRRRKPMKVTPPNVNIIDGKDWEFIGFTQAQLIARLTEANVVALNGLVDPSSVAWELVPWSFVADWFIPIGNYLAARGMAQAVTGTFVTTITEREYFRCNSLDNASNQWQVWDVMPQYFSTRVSMNRTVSSVLSTPKPQFKQLDEVLSWKRAANAVSLLITGFSRGHRK